MKNWIGRLFGGDDKPRPAGTAHASPNEAPDDATDEAPNQAAADQPDLAFWHWLSSGLTAAQPASPAPPAPHIALVLAELKRLGRDPAAGAELVPRMPDIIPQLLRSLRDEGVSSAELARQVGRDPALAGEVIREANSPFYRQSAPARSIDAALLVLGQNGLRMLLARAAFRPIVGMQGGVHAKVAAPRAWSHTERCALAASLLAPSLQADPFEAYLAGLMHDLGLIVALRLFDRVADAPALPQDAPSAVQLLAAARELSGRIALYWDLPPPVAAAILSAGSLPDALATPLSRTLQRALGVARLRLLADHGLLAPDSPAVASLDAAQQRVFERLAPAA
jgi:HD-like signal output (HDOD) protein